MIILFAGLIVFFGVHMIPLFPGFRAGLVAKLGAARFKGVYSLAAGLGFGLIILGMSRAEFRPLYAPVAGAREAANFVMPVSFALLAAANMPNNIRRLIRHPMLTGVALWAFVHLLANGDLASTVLFASFGAYALIDIVAVSLRGKTATTEPVPLYRDAIVLAAGYAVFWIVRHFHLALFGVPAVI